MLKKIISLILVVAITASISITGTMAYLQHEDSDVNVMTLGNVTIEQHEYERALNEDGTYKTDTFDSVTSYVLQDFTQEKALLPIVGDPSTGAAGWDETTVRMTQVGSYGGMQVFAGKNAQDKFVTVKNTGKTDAYIRTLVAIEVGTADADLIGTSYHSTWEKDELGTIAIDGVNYYVIEYLYKGGQLSDGSWRHENGILPAGDTSYPNLSQVYLKSEATNDDMKAIDGNENGKLDIVVISQAIQAAGFENAKAAFDAGFPKGENNANVAEWFDGIIVPTVKTLEELRVALADGGEFKLGADINVASDELLYEADGGHSDGSAFIIKTDVVLDLNGYNITVDAPSRSADVFFVRYDHDVTFKGEGNVTADCGIIVSTDATTTVNVEGGHWKCTADNDMLYAMRGKINVSGGTFETTYWNLINIYGQGNITLVDVSGGSFKNWNPAASPDGNLLADGYKSVAEVVDGVTWYTVVAE